MDRARLSVPGVGHRLGHGCGGGKHGQAVHGSDGAIGGHHELGWGNRAHELRLNRVPWHGVRILRVPEIKIILVLVIWRWT